jgi:serine phosphatase RsbU (regulator of sigma subunit)
VPPRTPSKVSAPRRGLQELAQRGGAVSAAVGIALTLLVAAFLMRAALIDDARRESSAVGALLTSSCQAAVALGDQGLVQETLDELAPRLPDLAFVEVHAANGELVGHWASAAHSDSLLRGSTPIIGSSAAVVVGRVDIGVSTRKADEAVRRMWGYLGLIGLVSLAFSTAAAMFVGRAMAEKSRLEGEVAVAERVQTAVLPRALTLEGFELAARMLTASEVGGDYYDVIPSSEGGFVCIGDVVGHGLPAGLVMLMMQSGLSTALRRKPPSAVGEAVQLVNEVLYENGVRMGSARHASLSVLRCAPDGAVECAGGHLDPIVRRTSGDVVTIEAPGPFVGLEPDIEREAITSTTFQLDPGELMLLYTDGLSEARRSDGEMFGPERLRAVIAATGDRPVSDVLDAIFDAVRAWTEKREDDMTAVVVRRLAARA